MNNKNEIYGIENSKIHLSQFCIERFLLDEDIEIDLWKKSIDRLFTKQNIELFFETKISRNGSTWISLICQNKTNNPSLLKRKRIFVCQAGNIVYFLKRMYMGNVHNIDYGFYTGRETYANFLANKSK